MEVVIKLLGLLLVALLCVQETNGFRLPKRPTMEEYHKRFRERASNWGAGRQEGAAYEGRVFSVIQYGADPTGAADSSAAFQKAVENAFQVQNGKELMPGVNDLGGVVISLDGGNYKLSQPIRFPPNGGGNLVIQEGTLRAAENFPGDRHLVELWSTKSKYNKPNGAGQLAAGQPNIFYEDITFRDVLFDSTLRGGGILVVDSVRIRIDNCFFIHFTTSGIQVEGGHETFISSCFLGQHPTVGADPREKDFSGTAIDLGGNDNAVTDVAIFSAAIGVLVRGQANILTGVHCYNKATGWGGVGIYVKLAGLGQTRIDNCYMDYTGITIEDPVQVHITNAFFLGDASVLLKSIKGKISGLTIVDNMFSGSNRYNPIIKIEGKFSSIDQVVIDDNNVNSMQLKSTVGKMTVAGNGTKWVADFAPLLVFPQQINHVQYSFYVKDKNQITAHAVTGVANNTVVVESKEAVDAVVTLMVDQNSIPGEKNLLV